MLIIGITGTIGAGKGTVVDYLVNEFHFQHFSVRKYLTHILLERGIEPNRDTFTTLANELRALNQSPSFLIEELYREALKLGKPAIIESIRTIGEIDMLSRLGKFYLLAVDADQNIRYRRIIDRKSETDRISFDKFKEDEAREMTSSDPNHQNLGACIQRADYTIMNDLDLPHLYTQIKGFLEHIKINIDHERIS